MPGSCESDNSSPSLISSLRNFRFARQAKRYQPPNQASPSSTQNSHSSKEAPSSQAPESTSFKDVSNGTSSKKSLLIPTLNNQPSPVASTSTQQYGPLSYRKYDSIASSQFLLTCIISKFQQVLKKSKSHNTELEITVTNEEVTKIKELILQDTSIAQKWKSCVTHEEHSFDSSCEKVLKVNRRYVTELLRLVKNVYNHNLTAAKEPTEIKQVVRTYTRSPKRPPNATPSVKPVEEVVNSQPVSNPSEEKGIMDEYEVFCSKEQNLRKLLDAFPGADIMEAQDILAKCNWNLPKAMVAAQSRLRSSKKRAFSTSSVDSTNSQTLEQVATPQSITAARTSTTSSTAEEIVLDSSDDEDIIRPKPINNNNNNKSSLQNQPSSPPAKRPRTRITSSDSDEDTPVQKTPSLSANSATAVKPLSVAKPLPSSAAKPSTTVNSEAVAKQITVAKSLSVTKPSNPVQNTATVSKVAISNLGDKDKTFSMSQAVSVKAVPAASTSSSTHSVSVKAVPAASTSSSTHSVSVKAVPAASTSSSSHSVSVKAVPAASTTSSSSHSVSVKAVSAASTSSSTHSVSSAPASKSIPNLPKGLVITQVGNSSNASNSNLPDSASDSSTSSVTSQQSETANIPAFTRIVASDSNHKKSAQVVRIQSSNGVSMKQSDSSSATTQSQSLSIIPKGVTLTPVGSGASSSQSTSDVPKPKNSKGKRKKDERDDEDDEDYGNDLIYDSDDSDFEEENLTSAHSAVLKYFQESTPEELMCIPGCSKKKVDSIMNIRPFQNWGDLVAKLGTDKYLSTDLLNGAKKVLDMRSAINKLMTRCQQISLDMEDLVENLKENQESSSGYVSKQPELLNDRMHLTSYQMLGLNWLLLMDNQEVNGILADEMGLGKTVQAIAFLAYLKQVSNMSGPHLIVVPSSVMDNWKQEFKTWWPDVSMICYHGSQDSRRELRMKILNDEVEEFDVMVTTYNMVTSSSEDRGFFKRLEFHYVIFDEAHMLKNMASQRYQHLMKIKAPRRLLLTGTPLQNNLVELMSLLIFAMPNMFSGKTEHIKHMFSSVSKTEGNKNTYEKDRIDHAKRIMKPFVLRRLKRDVLQDLPPKHDETKLCPMSEDQAKKYEDLVATFSAEVQNSQEKEAASIGSGTGMMMQLRRAANHPLLLRRFYNENQLKKMSKAILKEPTHTQSDPNLVFEDMSVMSDFELHQLCKKYKSLKSYVLSDEDVLNSGKFRVLDSLLPSLIEEGHRILLFSQFTMVLDIVEDYMNIKKYKFLRLDGQVPVTERQQLIDEFNTDSEIFVFLLSTRAGGLGINLTAADTVILHDIDFNPYNDKQAEDRCHRVGQMKDVSVLRLISENTIEEGILQRATEKLKLERDIHEVDETEENDVASVAKLLREALGLKSNKS